MAYSNEWISITNRLPEKRTYCEIRYTVPNGFMVARDNSEFMHAYKLRVYGEVKPELESIWDIEQKDKIWYDFDTLEELNERNNWNNKVLGINYKQTGLGGWKSFSQELVPCITHWRQTSELPKEQNWLTVTE